MRKQTKLWKTKDGRKVRICDMTDSHLDNTIALLRRLATEVTHETISEGYSVLNSLSGEIAIDAVESDLMYLEEHGIEPSEICGLYDNLVDEKERRLPLV